MTTATTRDARNFRGTHTEGRSPEELRELVSHVGAELELAPAEHIIEWAVATFGDRFCITSSMGDAVLAHLAAKVAPGVDVVFLDTGYHFAETIGTRDAVEATLDVNLITITPVQSVAEQDAEHGKDLYKTNPDLCCALRKVAPLASALEGYDAWATGLRRAPMGEEEEARARLLAESIDKWCCGLLAAIMDVRWRSWAPKGPRLDPCACLCWQMQRALVLRAGLAGLESPGSP